MVRIRRDGRNLSSLESLQVKQSEYCKKKYKRVLLCCRRGETVKIYMLATSEDYSKKGIKDWQEETMLLCKSKT